MKPFLALWIPSFLAFSTGCVLGADYRPPQPELPAHWGEALGAAEAPPDDWWRAFGDPELSSLVARALRSSPDLHAAVARLRAARAQRGLVDAALFPELELGASYSNSRFSENGFLQGLGPSGGLPGAVAPGQRIDLEQVALDASWELDLFGRVRREKEAARAELEGELASLDGVLVSLVAEVADGYLELCGLGARLALSRAREASLRATRDLVREREQAGVAGQFELTRAETALSSASAGVFELEAAARIARQRVEALVGVQPGTLAPELEPAHALPSPPAALAVGIPSDLLLRRPDVRAAERRLAATSAHGAAQRADLLPRFSLTGTFGLQSQSLSDVASWDSRFWAVGPEIRWPLLDFGRRDARIAMRDAEVKEARARYDGALLGALADVEGALARLARAERRRGALEEAERSAARSEELAEELRRSGLLELADQLEVQREHQAAEEAALLARVAEARDAVALFRALGGGWETTRREFAAAKAAAGTR